MPRRLLALALAFGVLGAPVASEICRAFCGMGSGNSLARGLASHQGSADSHDQASHQHHATDAQPLSTSAAMNPVAHPCDELPSLVMDVRAGVRASVETAVIPSPAFAVVIVHVSATSDVDSRHGPPGAIRSIAPLRI